MKMNSSLMALTGFILYFSACIVQAAPAPIVGTPNGIPNNNMTYPGQNLPQNNAFQGPASNPYNQNRGPASPAQQAIVNVNTLNNTYTCQMAGVFTGTDGKRYQCTGAGTFTIPK